MTAAQALGGHRSYYTSRSCDANLLSLSSNTRKSRTGAHDLGLSEIVLCSKHVHVKSRYPRCLTT